jgi:hypothetical protein
MRLYLVLATLVAAVAVAGAGAGPVRSVTAPAPVLALAFDGARVAYASGRTARDCNRVHVWNLATRAVTRLGRRTHCIETSTGNAIAALSIAGTRVLWLHYAGGNFRDWSLWTATTSKPAPVRVRTITREADEPAPIVLGEGDSSRFGDLLPYAVGSAVVVLRANGSPRFTWTAPARVVALAARDGELAVASAGRIVTVLDAGGRVLATEKYGSEIDAVRITGKDLVAQSGRSLEVRGGRVALYTLIGGVKLADADGSRAVLVGGGKVRMFDLDTGFGGIAASGSFAQLERARLASAAGRMVTVR